MNAQTIINKAIAEKVTLMGDDFIGFKFVGEDAGFYNKLLVEAYQEGQEVLMFMNSKWLNENKIPYVEYESNIWNEEETK